MKLTFDVLTDAFLSKISEYDFLTLSDEDREFIVDGFMKRSIAAFKKNCLYDLTSTRDDISREFEVEIEEEDLDEIVDIISEGMVAQWMKPFLHKQEVLNNVLNTRDYTLYSPAELIHRIKEASDGVNKRFIQMIREYSFNHGALKELHI